MRKNVKDSDDKGGGDAGDVGDFDEVNRFSLSMFPLPHTQTYSVNVSERILTPNLLNHRHQEA